MALGAAMLGLENAHASDQAMTGTRTHCVGRFLIDLPEEAEYVGGYYEYGFAKIERESMEHSMFQQEVERFEKRLQGTKHKSGTSLLLKKDAPDDNTRVYGYWDADYQDILVDLSGYRWINGQRYLAKLSADPDKMERAAKRLGTILANLHAMETNAPTAKGFCIEHALIADEGTSTNESADVHFRLKNHPDIVLDVSTNRNSGSPPESLLSRKPGLFSALGILGATIGGIRNIRDGDRKVGDHPGQEWLMKAPNEQGQKAHLFTWEAPGLHRDALHPQIRFDLQSGNFNGGLTPGPISMTDKQMLKLWDQILNSLRLRPTDEPPQNVVQE